MKIHYRVIIAEKIKWKGNRSTGWYITELEGGEGKALLT